MKSHSANAKWHHGETKKMLDEFEELQAKADETKKNIDHGDKQKWTKPWDRKDSSWNT